MKVFFVPTALRTGLLAALLIGGLTSCHDDQETVTPDPPVADPTPYNLVLPSNFNQQPTQPIDNPLTNEGVELGRHLFYEKALSIDNSVACSSCHQQVLAFTDGLARARGVHGGQHARSAMPLQNLLWEKDLAWDGAAQALEAQARVPLQNPIEMGQSLAASAARLQAMPKYVTLFNKAFKSKTITEENLLKALAQFERTLISGNSRFDRYMRGEFSVLNADELAGKKLFETHPGTQLVNGRQVFVRGANCGDCHSGNLQTNALFSNNALDATFADLGRGAITGQTTDNGKFRVPSLRNIALTAPYMHDGRFTTLEAVVDHYNTGLVANSPNSDVLLVASNDPYAPHAPLGLTTTEKRQLVAFLKTFTDSTFIQDSRFAQPAQ